MFSLYVKSSFSANYTGVTGFRGLVSLLYTGVLILVQSYEIGEYKIAISGCIAMIVQNLFFGFGQSMWIIYLGTFVGGAAHFVIPILRKIMAERVDEAYLGSLFAIPSWIECGATSQS